MSQTSLILPPSGPIASLSAGDRAVLSKAGTFESIKPGEKLIHQGKPHGRLFFVLSGAVQAKREENGRVEILGKIPAGEWLGEINIFDPSTAVCSVEAIEPTEYWFITRDAFEQFINKNHAAGSILLIGLAMTLSQRIRALTEKRTTPAKSKSKPFLWAGLVLTTLIAIAATVIWLGGLDRIKQIGVEGQRRVSDVERELELSQAKTKDLEKEIAQLEEEIDWAKSEAAKKSTAPSSPPSHKPSPTTPSNNESEPSATPPADQPHEKPESSRQSPADSVDQKPKTHLLAYPPEITLTEETRVPLTVAGKISGSAKIAPGKTFKVVGVDEEDVLVTMAGSTVRIPKENSNFDEALAEAEDLAQQRAKRLAVATPIPTPKPTPVPTATPTPQNDIRAQASANPATAVESIIENLAPRKTVEEIQDFRKPGKESARASFMKSEALKWTEASEAAKNFLRTQQPDEATKRLLKNIVLAAEMFETERFDSIEFKLREIDLQWLTLKTDREIYGSDGANSTPKPE